MPNFVNDISPVSGKLYGKDADGNTGFVNHEAVSDGRKTSGYVVAIKNRGGSERGSSGTYQSQFIASGPFYGVQPIINVSKAPDDATYTSNDIYDAIAVSPTASILDGSSLPNSTEGNAAWVAQTNVVVPRVAGASTANQIPVLLPFFPCSSVPRTDGGPGRILMARAYSTSNSHASAATTRMPTYHADQSTTTYTLWDDSTTGFPLYGSQTYYRSGNYASTNQDAFGASATRWGNRCIVGMKFHYCKPTLSVIGIGDSIMGGDYVETGHPIRASFLFRARYSLLAEGAQVDVMNCGISGAAWDVFGPAGLQLVQIYKPDVVFLPSWSPNGTATGVGTGNTVADAHKHIAQMVYYRDLYLAAGAKNVVIVTPAPYVSRAIAVTEAAACVRGSGLPYVDFLAVASDDGTAWKTGYSIDATHPTALCNAAVAVAAKAAISKFL